MSKLSKNGSARLQRQLLTISEYTTVIQPYSWQEQPIADVLSRAPSTNNGKLGLWSYGFNPIYRWQYQGLLQDINFGSNGTTLLCDVSSGKPLSMVSSALCKNIFNIIHRFSHPGTKATWWLLSSKFVWHGMAKQISWTGPGFVSPVNKPRSINIPKHP